MAITVSELLEKKYVQFCNEIYELDLPVEILNMFPEEIETVDWGQFIAYMQIAFPDREYIHEHLQQLADFQSVKLNDNEINLLVPLVLKYLLFLDKIKEKNLI